MCFFFILGVMPREKRVGTETRLCAFCGRDTIHTLCDRRLWFHFFFLPLFPVSKKETIARCESCQGEYGAAVAEPSQLPQVTGICRNCGGQNNLNARFCQYCGKPL